MSLQATFQCYSLDFKFAAGTSRGVLNQKLVYLLKLWNSENPGKVAIGEAGPIAGLSPDPVDLERVIQHLCKNLTTISVPNTAEEIDEVVGKLVPATAPSVRFALETAFWSLLNGAKGEPFPGEFTQGKKSIPINGLVWMGTFESMQQQIDQKIAEGYNCIKLKIGAIDFNSECRLLDYIRNTYGDQLILRTDANGAFDLKTVSKKLEVLSNYQVHSIEQPIKKGQWLALNSLCSDTPVPIALDEELIGITDSLLREALLDQVCPQYLVLKPTLLGGIAATRDWIRLAEERGIPWWITSALESNVGLNSLAQFTATLGNELPQGLGTGQIYKNNFPSQLYLEKGHLHYSPKVLSS